MSEQILRKEYLNKAEAIVKDLQQAVEGSFNGIDTQIDQIFKDKSNLMKLQSSLLSSDFPKVNLNLLQFNNDNFLKQLNQDVISLIKNNIKKDLQKKEQQLLNQYKEAQTKLEQKIQDKDTEIKQLKNSSIIQQSSTIIFNQSNLKPFTYQLIEENSIKQDQYCFAIAVNKDCSILVAGCDSQIKVFKFEQGVIKQVQLLSEHVDDVITLNFMKRSDQFISSSDDKQIIIWTRNQNNSWIFQHKLNGHMGYIKCLIINNNEDLIVSGSRDNTIKFWQEQNEWLCSQTITEHKERVWGLSLNQQQNRLISCGDDKLILVIEQQNKQWIIIQKIAVQIEGVRICFIDNNTFTFQPWRQDYMNIFEMDNINKQYIKTKDIKVIGGPDYSIFPQQYIKSKCILVNKNATNVSLLRKKQNGDFIIEQNIQFGHYQIFGHMTDDGQYLITWDYKSKEYQIRKYIEQ